MLRMVGLYDTLIGVILVKAALELPFGIWIMKGFYDTVPWEIEMAGLQDGANRFQVWHKLVLPQISPVWPRWRYSPSWPVGASSYCRSYWRRVRRPGCCRSISPA